MKPAIHRKLTQAQLERLREEVSLRAKLTPYKQLAAEIGLTHGSVKQLMAQMLRKPLRVHRGTDRGELAIFEIGVQ